MFAVPPQLQNVSGCLEIPSLSCLIILNKTKIAIWLSAIIKWLFEREAWHCVNLHVSRSLCCCVSANAAPHELIFASVALSLGRVTVNLWLHQPSSQTCNEKRLWTKEKLSALFNSLYLMLNLFHSSTVQKPADWFCVLVTLGWLINNMLICKINDPPPQHWCLSVQVWRTWASYLSFHRGFWRFVQRMDWRWDKHDLGCVSW